MARKRETEIESIEGTHDAMLGLVVGRLVEVGALGTPRVEYEGRNAEARTTVQLDAKDVGRAVVLAFERGDRSAPIVIGTLHEPLAELVSASNRTPVEVRVDGERVVLCAQREIVLECGESSLTLRRDGKVLIRGTHVLSRSSGPNRIKGASVNLN